MSIYGPLSGDLGFALYRLAISLFEAVDPQEIYEIRRSIEHTLNVPDDFSNEGWHLLPPKINRFQLTWLDAITAAASSEPVEAEATK